ncbi:MAG: hypothetical protein AAF226_16015, partial [Verrucomicrobiota bacterium]
MTHRKSRAFCALYEKLPTRIQDLADRKFALLKEDPTHPSLRFKKVGPYWSARVDLDYRCLGVQKN